jgi:alpha-D-xyloside xylohydrolase
VPLFIRSGAAIPFYPEPVACTDEMDLSRSTELVFDDSLHGFRSSALGKDIEL